MTDLPLYSLVGCVGDIGPSWYAGSCGEVRISLIMKFKAPTDSSLLNLPVTHISNDPSLCLTKDTTPSGSALTISSNILSMFDRRLNWTMFVMF